MQEDTTSRTATSRAEKMTRLHTEDENIEIRNTTTCSEMLNYNGQQQHEGQHHGDINRFSRVQMCRARSALSSPALFRMPLG